MGNRRSWTLDLTAATVGPFLRVARRRTKPSKKLHVVKPGRGRHRMHSFEGPVVRSLGTKPQAQMQRGATTSEVQAAWKTRTGLETTEAAWTSRIWHLKQMQLKAK